MIKEIFEELGLPENAHRIYLQLAENGSVSARQLAQNLSIPRPSIYDNLKALANVGLVSEADVENKKIFQIEDPKNLSFLIEEKISKLSKEKNEIIKMIPNLQKHLATVEPKIKTYSGKEALKQVQNDMLWYDNIKTYAMWPINEMIEVLGSDYVAEFTEKKIRHGIWSYVIWPRSKNIEIEKYPFLGVGEKYLREIRLAPEEMDWNMSYWVYTDKVNFISSQKECFGFVVHSREFADLMKMQHQAIWNLSKPIQN